MVTLTGGVDGYLQTILSSKSDSSSDVDLTTATVMPAPIFMSSPALAAALRQEPTIEPVLKQACSVEHAVVVVGTPTTDATIVQLGYLSAADIRTLREREVVGDILGQFFDSHGKVVRLPIHDRRIGIELSDLRGITKVVGVAGGINKAPAILGALHGRFLDVLATNELAAIRLQELERRAHRPTSRRH